MILFDGIDDQKAIEIHYETSPKAIFMHVAFSTPWSCYRKNTRSVLHLGLCDIAAFAIAITQTQLGI